ncbi:MAG: class I SAM-dependent methyltransferase [Myxococcota bacterium]
MAGYNYPTPRSLESARDFSEAVRFTILNYFHEQLGWSIAECEERVKHELERRTANSACTRLERDHLWSLSGAKVLDVGCGQGAALHELLVRGADAIGVEPGEEFAALARWRLRDSGLDENRVQKASGEGLPFANNTFDYALSLQVLEHVRDPESFLREVHRVLIPGGRFYLACENYLAFREQHYRVPWLPLLPKQLGAAYLRAIGRKPEFLFEHVTYTTYPQVVMEAHRAGFRDETAAPLLQRLARPETIRSDRKRSLARLIQRVPESDTLLRSALHARNTFAVGIKLYLVKPR